MPEKHITVQKRPERIIPREIQRHQMRDEVVVLGHARPWLRGYFAGCFVSEVMDVHDFAPEGRRACS